MVLKIADQIASATRPGATSATDNPFDRLLGHFGRWQLLVYGAVSLVKLSSGWVQMAILFLTPNLTFWCTNMTGFNITSDMPILNNSPDAYMPILNNSPAAYLPVMNNSPDAYMPNLNNSSEAYMHILNNSSEAYMTDFNRKSGMNIDVLNNTCYAECQKYEYDTSPFENTIISEWDLVCERRWLASFTQMVLQLGVLIGSILFGFLSDRYGRKNTFLLSIVTMIVFGFAIPFAPSYSIFTTLRFLLGVATAGSMVVSFVLVMETVGARYRGVVGCLFQIPFIIGHMTVPLFAYFYRSWDRYSLAMAVPPLVYLGYFFFLAESPRWLLSVGRVDEAALIVKRAAIINRLPTAKIDDTLRALSAEMTSKKAAKPNYPDLFRSSLRLKTACCCYVWLITGVTFFGFNQYISQTSPDPFVSVAAAGVMQIPSDLFAIWLIAHFGRKTTTILFLCLGGVCIITLGCVPDIFYLTLTLGCLGVSCAAIVATTIYIYSSELYPTVVRNMGMGACSMSMRVGSMLAPFISNLSVSIPWLPTVIFGLAPISAGLVCLCLPETKGRTLPDQLEDVKNETK